MGNSGDGFEVLSPSSSGGGSVMDAGRLKWPWSSRMARPEGVWRRGGRGLGGFSSGFFVVVVVVVVLFMPLRLDL